MECIIREINSNEYELLSDFLYEAIFIPEGIKAPSKNIIHRPELQVYVSFFGKKDDFGLLAEVDGKVVGAVWTRIMNDYGHIDDETPSLAIALFKEYRGYGIGTKLLRQMLLKLKSKRYDRVSLSVQKGNFAFELYLKVGFIVIDENESEYIMVCNLKQLNEI